VAETAPNEDSVDAEGTPPAEAIALTLRELVTRAEPDLVALDEPEIVLAAVRKACAEAVGICVASTDAVEGSVNAALLVSSPVTVARGLLADPLDVDETLPREDAVPRAVEKAVELGQPLDDAEGVKTGEDEREGRGEKDMEGEAVADRERAAEEEGMLEAVLAAVAVAEKIADLLETALLVENCDADETDEEELL
jgi:hypothetical protein